MEAAASLARVAREVLHQFAKYLVVGGVRTVSYKGIRIDIGGHRFFSKSDRVMQWWLRILPVQRLNGIAQKETEASPIEQFLYLTAMVAVDNILAGREDKANIWEVNTEQDYHEEKDTEKSSASR